MIGLREGKDRENYPLIKDLNVQRHASFTEFSPVGSFFFNKLFTLLFTFWHRAA